MDSIGFEPDTTGKYQLQDPSPLYIHRYLGGYGHEGGHLVLNLENPTDADQTVVVFDTVPWFMRIYMHTMEIWNGDRLQNGELC